MATESCVNCGEEERTEVSAYDYAALAGLNPSEYTVLLQGIRVHHCSCGETPEIPFPEILQYLVALELVKQAEAILPSGVRFLRKILGLKQTDFARLLDSAPETISRWENGHRPTDPKTEQLMRLCVLERILSYDAVADLLGEGGERLLLIDFVKAVKEVVRRRGQGDPPTGKVNIEVPPYWGLGGGALH